MSAFNFGEFSEKSLDAIKTSDAFINIFHGAVRSSKSISANIAFLKFIGSSPYDEFLLMAKTERTAYRNVIKDLQAMVYPRSAPYNKANAELTIFGKTVYIVGAKDEIAEQKIKGLTVAAILMDEVTTFPKSAVEMAITRASLPGSQIWMTCNPDNPHHYIYTDYITNEDLIKDGTVKVWKFELTDNPNLPKDYIERLKKIYKGVFFQRNVLGEWVAAEGAIYPMFSEHTHTFVKPPFEEYESYAVGMDYGTSTACCFGLFGIIEINNEIHYHLLKEFYHDAKETGKQMTDSQYADKMESFLAGKEGTLIYCSHDAVSLKMELKNRGFRVTSYKPDTLSDIRRIQGIIEEGRFMASEKCPTTTKQIQTYVWDLKASKKGIERPLKVEDHAVDMIRGPMCRNSKRTMVYFSVG